MLNTMIDPKKLFLVDAVGALVTAILLFFGLRPFQSFFGMPVQILNYLSLIATVFSIYSFSCFLFLKDHKSSFLKIIAIANLLYCCLTGLLLILYFSEITLLGWLYFLGEILIIVLLSTQELKVSRIVRSNIIQKKN